MYTVDDMTKRMSLKVPSAHVSSEMFFINLINDIKQFYSIMIVTFMLHVCTFIY